MNKIQSLQEELRKAKKELEIQTWGLNKTNQSVKLLYQELADKNKELEKLNELKTDFVNMVSHELRLPIAVIKEGICLLLDGATGGINEEQRHLFDVMNRSVERLAKMVNNILDISKIESGKMEIERNLVNLIDIIDQVVFDFKIKMNEKKLQLKWKKPDKDIVAYVDKDKIIQVFYNLVGNAVKFTPKGFVEIGILQKKNNIECYVADSGKGIRKEFIPKLFNKFEQFGHECDPSMKGSGLGLSIAKSIIDLHQGSIKVDSEINKGTKFTFTLPRYSFNILLKKEFSERIKHVLPNNYQFLFFIVFIENIKQLIKKLSNNKIVFLLEDYKNFLRDKLHNNDDFIYHNSHELFFIHSFYNKGQENKVKKLVKSSIDNYLHQKGLSQIVSFDYEYLSFPEQTYRFEKLMNKLDDKNIDILNLLEKNV